VVCATRQRQAAVRRYVGRGANRRKSDVDRRQHALQKTATATKNLENGGGGQQANAVTAGA